VTIKSAFAPMKPRLDATVAKKIAGPWQIDACQCCTDNAKKEKASFGADAAGC